MPDLSAQYRTSANLEARIALHQRFGTSPINWHHWVFAPLLERPIADVLEVGAGNGLLWRENAERIPQEWRVTLTDRSAGMIAVAQTQLAGIRDDFTFAVTNVTNLPYPDASFDVVIANHMLYHVPVAEAAREIQRVLRPGGALLATTNGEHHMQELATWLAAMQPKFAQAFTATGAAFTLENGAAQLAPYFTKTERRDYPDELRVTEVEPIIAYIYSMLDGLGADLPPEAEARLRAQLATDLARDGVITITKAGGMFIVYKA